MTPSAVGDRQMFPMQTKSRRTATVWTQGPPG
jgi:hypothetical protein